MIATDLKGRHRLPSGLIPAGLDDMEPGPVLAAFLSAIDVDELTGYDRIVVLRAHQRMASHYTAHVYADMASVADVLADENEKPVWTLDAAAAEIRAALTLTRRAADAELAFALELEERLPRVAQTLRAGVIDVRRAKTIVYQTTHLPPDTARAVVDRIIDRAPDLTTGQLAARLRRLCIDADPDEAQRRYEDAVAERRVVAEPTDSGTANLLGLDLPPHRVAAVTRRVNRIARSLRSPSESRTMDQLRADVLLDLLTGRHGRRRRSSDGTTAGGGNDRAVVDIVVDLETLTRLADHPGELAGYGPVIADIARQTVHDQADAEWRYTITDPDTGIPVADGITQRRPTIAQRRTVESRDRTCVFPGCRMPAVDCDLDHRIAWSEGGPTHVFNLAPACRHDHVIVKHGAGWTYRRLPNGDHRWTSRLGHTYITGGEKPP